MAMLERCLFCNCPARSVRSASFDADQLHGWEPVRFIRFVGPVRFCIYALSPAGSATEELRTDLPFTLISLAAGLGLVAFTYSLEFTGRAPATNGRIVLTNTVVPLLPCGGSFSFSDVIG